MFKINTNSTQCFQEEEGMEEEETLADSFEEAGVILIPNLGRDCAQEEYCGLHHL